MPRMRERTIRSERIGALQEDTLGSGFLVDLHGLALPPLNELVMLHPLLACTRACMYALAVHMHVRAHVRVHVRVLRVHARA